MLKKVSAIFAMALMLFTAGCGSKDSTPAPVKKPYEHGQLISRSGHPVLGKEFVNAAVSADYIILAEAHDNKHHHEMQALLLTEMVSAGAKPVVGLEMLSKEKQGTLDHFNSGKVGVAQLPARLDWAANWSFPFDLYRPVFDVAQKHKLPVAALNAPRSTARAVASNKAMPASEFKWLPKRLFGHDSKGYDKSLLDRGRHLGEDSMTTSEEAKATLREYARLRTLYEATIADAAVEMHNKHKSPVVILVGVEALRNGQFGLVKRLKEFAPGSRIIVVLPTKMQDHGRFTAEDGQSKHTRAAEQHSTQVFFYSSLPGRGQSY